MIAMDVGVVNQEIAIVIALILMRIALLVKYF